MHYELYMYVYMYMYIYIYICAYIPELDASKPPEPSKHPQHQQFRRRGWRLLLLERPCTCPYMTYLQEARVRIQIKAILLFKSLRLRPPTPEAYGKTADFGTLCIPGSSQRLDPSAALLSSRPQPARCIECHADSLSCPLTRLNIPGVQGLCREGPGGPRLCNQP